MKVMKLEMNWTFHDGFYELEAKQMSEEWMLCRQFRLTTSKWALLKNGEKLADEICGNPIIDVSSLPTEIQKIITNEDNVRAAYIETKNAEMTHIRTPGLIVPNPFDKKYNFVPEHERFMLLHLGCSPDLLWKEKKGGKIVAVEVKEPANGVIYPDVLKNKQIRVYHRKQVFGTGGLVGSTYNDYFVWTKNNGFFTVSAKTSFNHFKKDVLTAIEFIKNNIITRPESQNLRVPDRLRDYYTTERKKYLTNQTNNPNIN